MEAFVKISSPRLKADSLTNSSGHRPCSEHLCGFRWSRLERFSVVLCYRTSVMFRCLFPSLAFH